jgi:hypothetical protein
VAREVEDACRAALFFDCDAVIAQPIDQHRRAARRVDDHVGAQLFRLGALAFDGEARDLRDRAGRIERHRAYARVRYEAHAGERQDVGAHRVLERRAAREQK